MQKIWIIIWRFSPLHIWHISLINYSLNNHNKTIVIIWSAEKIDEKNPYSLIERKQLLEKEFSRNIILEFLNDCEKDDDWISNLSNIIKSHTLINDNLNFIWWDLSNDYAIRVINEHIDKFKYNKINFLEKSRLDIPISATQIRKLLKENNFIEAKKWLSKRTTWLIIKKK